MRWIACVIAAIALALAGCGEPDMAVPVRIIRVDPHHATRATVTYEYSDGSIRRDSVHHSATLKVGGQTVVIGDYTNRRKPYGEVK